MHSNQYLIGIDEAGRGPLAGPVSVGVVCISSGFDWNDIPGVDDSKKLSEKKREQIFKIAKQLKKKGALTFAVSLVGPSYIDEIGIVPSVNRAMQRSLLLIQKELDLDPRSCFVKLDGSLKAPEEYIHQETIIKGDAKEKVIGLASILAKVTRDRYMVDRSKVETYARYGFEIHKGYATRAHRELILKEGLSDMHRRSFCTRLHSL
jgi:ribonuclease HII